MTTGIKRPVFTILLFVSLLTSSCAPKVTALYHDKSFTHDSITSSKMVIGGVTSDIRSLKETEINAYSNILRAVITAKRNEFDVIPFGKISKRLNTKDRKNMLDEYRRTGKLGKSWINKIKNNSISLRYIIFARIEGNEIRHRRSKRYLFNHYYPYYEDDPAGERTGIDISYRTYRRMTVSMDIYDLETGKAVWGGALTNSLRNIDRARHRWGFIHSFVSFPPEPGVEETLELIFGGFAANFPKLPKEKVAKP